MGTEAVEIIYANGLSKICDGINQTHSDDQTHNDSSWFEESIDEDLKWSFALNRFVCAPTTSMHACHLKLRCSSFFSSSSFCHEF